MRTRAIFLGLILVSSAIAFADDAKPPEAPKSSAAMTAIRERDHAVEVAEAVFRQAKIAAEKKLIEKLRIALIAVTKSGDLDEANRISANIKDAQATLDEMSSGVGFGSTNKVVIPADKGWVRITNVHNGDVIEFRATGTWCTNIKQRKEKTSGPDGIKEPQGGILPKYPHNALVGRIGDQMFFVGSSSSVAVEGDGFLELGINDDIVTDNDGSVTVFFRVRRK